MQFPVKIHLTLQHQKNIKIFNYISIGYDFIAAYFSAKKSNFPIRPHHVLNQNHPALFAMTAVPGQREMQAIGFNSYIISYGCKSYFMCVFKDICRVRRVTSCDFLALCYAFS